MHSKGIVAALAAVLVVAAPPASAVENLTGTYRMKLSCKGIQVGEVNKFKVDEPLYLNELGGGIVRFETGLFGPGVISLIAQLAKPAEGVLSGMTCAKSAFNIDGLVLRAEVKTKPGKDDASLKGTLVLVDPGDESSVCKLSAKRESLKAPKLAGCPAAARTPGAQR